MAQATATNTLYVSSNSIAGAPREIGYLQRVEGLSNGLAEMQDRLSEFLNRVNGPPMATPANAVPPREPGLSATLTEAESRLRSCMATLGQLNDAF